MWTGRKEASQVAPGEEIASHSLWLAIVLVGLAAVTLWRVIAAAPAASMSVY
jgi:hypothetical protein